MDNNVMDYILKHSKNKDKELKYDFMPSILEIINRSSHKAGTVIILGIFTLLIVVIMWACLSKIDVVITSSGNIQPIGNLNVVQSYSSGLVKSIKVSEGSYVKKGDLLIELDTQSIEIDENQLNLKKKILKYQMKLYKKIINNNDISKINIDDYSTKIQPYVQEILDNYTSHKNTIADLEKEKYSSDLNQQIAQVKLEEYKENGAEYQVQSQKLLIQQYTLSSEQIALQIKDAESQYSSQVNSKLAEINSQLDEIRTDINKYRLSENHLNITAPVSGYVNSLDINTIGETITSAQELMTIVPDDTALEMVCYVTNMDIANVKIGMETEIKLEAYPYNKYGTIKGKVKYISPSSFVSEQMGNVYLVKIEITDENDNINIISGLSGTVEIKTDKRTIMDYFLEPIIKGFGESLKEK